MASHDEMVRETKSVSEEFDQDEVAVAVDSRTQCAQFGDSSFALSQHLIQLSDRVELGTGHREPVSPAAERGRLHDRGPERSCSARISPSRALHLES